MLELTPIWNAIESTTLGHRLCGMCIWLCRGWPRGRRAKRLPAMDDWAPHERRTAALVATGRHQRQLWVLDRMLRSPSSDAAARPAELAGLAFAFLGMAYRARMAQAKARFRRPWGN